MTPQGYRCNWSLVGINCNSNQSNKFTVGAKMKATGDSKLNVSPDYDPCLPKNLDYQLARQ